ncbi:MAG: acetate--CoA ligase family protein [Methanobacterium sp.]|nr:acetate--CoA ligase family protein [Methanobacterium sp.]
MGFSNFVSLGNKADLDEVDFIEEFAEDPNTKIILAYIESVGDGDKFLKIIPEVTKKKPVIIIKSGTSEAGSRAASSHTGALAGNDIAFDLAFEKTGVIRARTMTDLFNLAAIFNKAKLPLGKNFAIVTNAGGPGILTTDGFENYGLGLTKFSKETTNLLREKLPHEATVYNPVDIIGDAPPERYKTALEIVFQEPNEICAGTLVLVTPQSQTNPSKVAEVLKEIQEKYPEKLIVAVFMGGISMVEPIKILHDSSIPCYEFPELAIESMKYMTVYANLRKTPDIPDKKAVAKTSINKERVKEILKKLRSDGRNVLHSSETSEIFSIYGIKSPKTFLAKSSSQTEELDEKVGYPLVMKVVSPDIIHKSDIGGVILGIKDKYEAKKAYSKINSNTEKYGPLNTRILGVEIQEMINTKKHEKNNELIIGMSRDPQWGPLLMVGTGGIYTNFIKDVAFDLSYNYGIKDAQKLNEN